VPDAVPAAIPSLRIRFLGVDGFLVEAGDDAMLSAPLFTRPSMIAASTGRAFRPPRTLRSPPRCCRHRRSPTCAR